MLGFFSNLVFVLYGSVSHLERLVHLMYLLIYLSVSRHNYIRERRVLYLSCVLKCSVQAAEKPISNVSSRRAHKMITISRKLIARQIFEQFTKRASINKNGTIFYKETRSILLNYTGQNSIWFLIKTELFPKKLKQFGYFLIYLGKYVAFVKKTCYLLKSIPNNQESNMRLFQFFFRNLTSKM